MERVATVLAGIQQDLATLLDFLTTSTYAKRRGDPNACDFVLGNPHEMPLPGLVDAMRRHAEPQAPNWFAYQQNESHATEAIAASLRTRHGMPFEPDDVFVTPGSFGALSVALRTLVNPGDEVIFVSPPWFFYEPMIKMAGGSAVRVTLRAPFDLDVESIASAITARTCAVLINSPHNPTGRIYPREQLQALAAVLTDAARTHGRRITLLSDESYNRILFDDREFVTPASLYSDTFIVYTYGKQLLAPGERVGYIALPPQMPDREPLREALVLSQIVGGWQFANPILQRAIGDLEDLSIDIGALQRRRDRIAAALTEMGYDVVVPEATFYMMVRSPIDDDGAFTEALAEHDVFVGPGTIFEMPGYFRISLTATDDMVGRALAGFEAALKQARA